MQSKLFFQACPCFSLPSVPSHCRRVFLGRQASSPPTPLIFANRKLINRNAISHLLPSPIGTLEVVFVKDGNIQVWDEATQQTRTIVNTGDVFSVTMSDDGQMIAFTRGSWVGVA